MIIHTNSLAIDSSVNVPISIEYTFSVVLKPLGNAFANIRSVCLLMVFSYFMTMDEDMAHVVLYIKFGSKDKFCRVVL